MTTATTHAPATREEILARIEEIGPILRENAPIADRERRLPDASIEAIASTGAFHITTPAEFGGSAEGARTLVDVARELGRYCPSSAWVTVISNGSVMLTTRFPRSAQERVFANGPVRMASVIVSPGGSALREGDGYRISGEWPFASNSSHSDWVIGVVPVRESEDAEPQLGYVLLNRDDITIRDTWFTIGMRGTASNTMSRRTFSSRPTRSCSRATCSARDRSKPTRACPCSASRPSRRCRPRSRRPSSVPPRRCST